ncbi:MAG: class I SAM-dependent methyltransferase [Sedimenticola selenatireducens]|uniref:Ribosomal RNA small subunit methyltransferase J n=1 Tax=Sedimenticola selenatireducens TaxID=191960 RepID=A0A557SMX1_9GAMM|nr:class I SAM-dependent methyltransferase [Sedimenticola selenatireducens]TVT62131.1 MAG: class I SAM-dependent methyltransferase [Sedimenticola selenatireducens]
MFLGIAAASPNVQSVAAALAADLAVPLIQPDGTETGLLLLVTEGALQLRQFGPDAPGPVQVDFVEGKAAHRRKFGGGRGQPLAKAIGLKKGWTPRVLDMTAGLGRDAFVLATLGCEVEMIERSPVVYALLQDGLNRARDDADIGPIISRMKLQHLDGRSYSSGTTSPEVVYLDPMYPHREKSAKVKKEMRLFQLLLGDDQDSAALLERALVLATRRVVVKRPAKAPFLGEQKPSVSITSPNTRYDIYLIGTHHAAT